MGVKEFVFGMCIGYTIGFLFGVLAGLGI